MTIIYLEVKPHKLSNRELAKVFETLKRQGQVSGVEDKQLTTTIGKSYYVRQNHKYVTIRLPEDKIDAFVERTKIDDSDIRSVRGGISRDLTALEQQLEEDEAVPDYNYPSLPLIPTGDPHKSILETISKMDEKPFNLEENANREDNMNVTLSTFYEMDDEPPEKPLSSGNKVPILLNEVVDDAAQDQSSQNGWDIKLDAGLAIPIWKKGEGPEEEILNTRRFIRDLKRLKTLGVIRREPLLINAALVKSGRTQIYEELPAQAETSVDELAKYLQKAYGMNRFDMLKELKNVKQGPTENPHAFLSRVINLFYEAKGKAKKTMNAIKQNEEDSFEIIALFWQGLYDERVRVALKQRMDQLKIESLADTTKNIVSSYEDIYNTSVNVITGETDDIIKEHPNPNCYICGRPNHIARNCWYNDSNEI